VLAHAPFVEGRLRTDLVDTDWDPRPSRAAAERRAAAAVAAAWQPPVAGPRRAGTDAGDPWRIAARRDAVREWRR
jgi:hypothetical protein